jgi:hypothetical protein
MAGASGGGLAAILATCSVRPTDVISSAYDMSLQHAIWDRPTGLVGMWGSLIEAWLDALLPADAAERCSGQVDVIVTQLPRCNQLAISDFRDKSDLINVAMASAHVPLLLDGKLSRDCRGVACVDGERRRALCSPRRPLLAAGACSPCPSSRRLPGPGCSAQHCTPHQQDPCLTPPLSGVSSCRLRARFLRGQL